MILSVEEFLEKFTPRKLEVLKQISEEPHKNMSELSKQLEMESSTLTDHVNDLESMELVERDYHGKEATVHITEKKVQATLQLI